MAHQLLSVCIFCFICATHYPCSSHAEVGRIDQHRHENYKDPSMPRMGEQKSLHAREKINTNPGLIAPYDDDYAFSTHTDKNSHFMNRRDLKNETPDQRFDENSNKSLELNTTVSENSDKNVVEYDFLKTLFTKYGDGENMTREGLERIFMRIDNLKKMAEDFHNDAHNHLHSHEKSSSDTRTYVRNKCLKSDKILGNNSLETEEKMNQSAFLEACPLILSYLVSEPCHLDIENEAEQVFTGNNNLALLDSMVWLYSILAVVLISICGILALVIIPVMQKRFYKPLIQFLVALAVGTLAGDALLHLLPHAMGGAHGPTHTEEELRRHNENTWKGFVAMMGLTFFFIMERLILLAGKWRKQKQKDGTSAHAHVKVLNDQGEKRADTQCMDKYNTSPYCYKDIINDAHSTFLPQGRSATTVLELLGSNSDLHSTKKSRVGAMDACETNSNNVADVSSPCIEAKMLPNEHEDYTVIVREHTSDHHGHSHKHGHVHAAPQDFSSVAWMVIMGDGLHNFTDGMAIGAAFSSGLAGGFSTTVAVFCHELPHELGDFAMLLKAGMSIKQALFYNMLSSVLCILGNLFGLWLGNTESANSWVFALAAGTFIYIALVDMIPELSSAHEDEDNLLQCVLHLSGLLLGFGIMTLIALYEHDLKHMFHEE